nr:MAG TPA: hypothetical protein [Caudoviricetes sp.]
MEELILKNEEFKEKIVQDINESQLPAFILKPIIKDIYEQIITLEQKQYMEAKNNREKEKKQNKKEVK